MLSTVTRRQFLSRAAVAGAAPFVMTSLSDRVRAAASERLTVGVIGTGKRGHTLLRNFLANDDVQVVAVCDVEKTRSTHARNRVEEKYSEAKAGGKFRGCDEYVDYRDILSREDIDCVVIATPDHWHALPVVEAARAKKDIYCEKPLSLTIREARVMADQVKKAGVVFQTGSQQRSEFRGRFLHACELVRSGRIGKLQTVHVKVSGGSRPCDLPTQATPDSVDWERWLGPAPLRGYNEALSPRGMHNHFPAWRNYQEYSGGGFTDMGAHHFDIAQWGMGADDSGPVEIVPPDGRENSMLTYRYANGVTLFHGGPRGVLFTGTEGVILVDRSFFQAMPEAVAKDPIGDDEVHLYRATNHVRNFLDCVRSREETICPAEVGCRSVTICHLGNLAVWNKRPLRWDPQAYKFIDDATADSWLDRPKRGAWQKDWDRALDS